MSRPVKSDRYFHLASAIADQVPVDWQENTMPFDPSQPLLKNLAIIESIAKLTWNQQVPETPQRIPDAYRSGAALFRWGHLDVLKKIGEGGYGEVFRAWDRTLHRHVALKLCRSERAVLIGSRPYLEEARRLARVRHPNVLAIHGADTHEGRVGLWCDLVDGETLASWVDRNGPMPYAQALEVARQVAEAMAVVHEADMVHGDIKMANIMLRDEKHVVLMDFGAVTDLSNPSDITNIIGTPMYMAPEVMAGTTPSRAADLYSLGVLLYRLSTGNYPFQFTTFERMLEHKRQCQYETLANLDGYPRKWCSLIDQCLSPNPRSRIDADQFLVAVRDLEQAPERRKRRIRVFSSLIFLTVIAFGFAALSWRLAIQVDTTRREAQTAESLITFLVDMFDSARPAVSLGYEVTAEKIVQMAIQQQAQDRELSPLVKARVQGVLGIVMRQLGDMDQAQALLKQADLRLNQEVGLQNRATLSIRSELTYLLTIQGRFDEAIELGKTILPFSRKRHPDIHAEALIRVARAYEARRDIDQARALFSEAQELIQDNIDRFHWEAMDTYNAVGNFEMRMGNLEVAEENMLLAKRLNEKYLPAVHPNHAIIEESLSKLEERKGNYIQALHHNQRAVDINRAVFSDDHPNLVSSYSNQGRLLIALNRHAEAEKYMNLALEKMSQNMASDSPKLSNHRLNFGNYLMEMGEYQRAIDMLAPVLEVYLKIYGPQGPETGFAYLSMGNCYLALKEWDAAERFYQKALDVFRDATGYETQLGLVWNNLGELQTKAGRYQQAELSFTKALDAISARLGERHPVYGAILLYRVDLHLECKRVEQAAVDLTQAQSILMTTGSEEGPDYHKLKAYRCVIDHFDRLPGARDKWLEVRPELVKTLPHADHPDVAKFDRWMSR